MFLRIGQTNTQHFKPDEQALVCWCSQWGTLQPGDTVDSDMCSGPCAGVHTFTWLLMLTMLMDMLAGLLALGRPDQRGYE
jgi:hypothetical protein